MKRIIIFSNGNLSDTSQVRKVVKEEDVIICADGGAKYAFEHGLVPDVVIGDMDSIEKDIYTTLIKKGTKIRRFSTRKDKTDFELVVDLALRERVGKILIFGLFGDRIDHFIANINLLKKIKLENKSMEIVIHEGNKTMYFVDKELELVGNIHDELSVIPLTKIEHITLEGFVYPLNKETLDIGTSRGISNEFREKRVKIRLMRGLALVIHTSKTN